MKKTIILLLNFFLLSQVSRSQEFCATVHGNTVKNYTSLSRLYNANIEEEETICLNIFFHIVRNNDGSGGISPYDTNLIIENLNNYYAQHQISFIKLGQDFINNTDLNEILWPSEQEQSELILINNVPNAINVYIVDNAFFNGWAEDIPSKNLILRADASTTNVSSHEIGHCLNLYHTHETQFGVEDEDNCSYAGDLICDTPPDSNIRMNGVTYLDNYCNYTKNDGYNPDTENIMSYTSPSCLRHFTNQQAIRMFDSVMNDPIIQSVISCECTTPTLIGNSTICTNTSSIFKIVCGTATFTTSSNLHIITINSNSITVQPINNYINGVGTIYATINGETIQKDIWIGKPKISLNIQPDSNYVYLSLEGLNSDVQQQNIEHISWEIVSSTGNPVMGSAINSFENIAHGSNQNWSIEALIKVTNYCGTTNLYKTIQPEPCVSFRIIYNGSQNFSVYKIIDPCAKISSNNIESVKDKDIMSAKLYDIYGIEVKEFKKNSFITNDINSGIYIFEVLLNNQKITQKIIIN